MKGTRIRENVQRSGVNELVPLALQEALGGWGVRHRLPVEHRELHDQLVALLLDGITGGES
ncbi:hypothetical protein [Kutzneria sp. CA-103260]|uniref:hypothetical protein n=1 Tax=Kutzneria sp. CA-103260 TaxID=2802641 RepID=UPI001BAA8E5B|nr:hypothetical protein [Kutzneria sp. CA-103260]